MNFGIRIDAPASRVWRLIADTDTWPYWGPTVRKVDSPERFIRTGLKGRILTPFGIWVPFGIEKCQPERIWDGRGQGENEKGGRGGRRGRERRKGRVQRAGGGTH